MGVQIPPSAILKIDDKSWGQIPRSNKQTKQKNKPDGFEYEEFLLRLKQVANQVPHAKLEQMQSVLRKIFAKRFRTTRKTPKYGSLNKAPTELELEHFLRNVPNSKFGILFKYQAYLGLRIGEVCKLHINNIDFEKHELTIKTEKANKIESLLIPSNLFKETVEYIVKNEISIKASNGYIFFKDNDNNNNGLLHIDTNYARRVFRDVCKKCNLDVVYDYSEELYDNHKSRPLHRLTTHSLRHYAITRFAKSTNGNVVLASRFARHSNVTTTMRYIAKDNEQLYREIDFAFSDKAKTIKSILNATKKS